MKQLKELIEVLKEEEIVYSRLLDFSNKKTEYIADENMEELSHTSRQEEEYVKQAKLLEYKREDMITVLEKTFNIEKIDDISSLLKHIEDENIKNELIEVQLNFKNTLNELKRVNTINNTLISDALEYITLSLNLISQATTEGTYGKNKGDIEPQTQHKSMFDFKG